MPQTSEIAVRVAEDIYQVRIPLPYLLNHVYCYLLRGDDGWTVVDTGLNHPEAQEIWKSVFTALNIQPSDIRRIVLTHMHPDHFGMAGWFQEISGAPVMISQRDYDAAQIMWIHRGGRDHILAAFFVQCGTRPEDAQIITDATEATAKMTAPYPQRFEFLEPDTTMTFGGRDFQVIAAPGHCDGQLIFYHEADKLLLSGDHVLMKITPNIGLWPHIDPAPLARYLASLNTLRDLDVQVALPGHKSLITDWRGRIGELLAHHDHRLALMRDAAKGATVYDVSRAIFDFDRLTVHELRFALAETLAHLEYLRETGVLAREDRSGVWVYDKQ
jgi:glyoxylase-like metal-dependent hydrolase (beta-lactamase superfamily II)